MNLDLSKAIDIEIQESIGGFPFEIFPREIQLLIENANRTRGFNREFLAAGILSACGTAIGNTVNLFNGSYIVKPIFWISIIGGRGTGKTHPLGFALKPIEDKDQESYILYLEELREYNKNKEDKNAIKPMYLKYILKDFTPEKLTDSLNFNKKGVLIFNDELMRWINSFNQYNKGGDQQMYLSLFNGGSILVERMIREPQRINETNVNILGGLQPEILKSLAKNNRDEDGFLDRMLFVYPDNQKPNLFTGFDIEPQHVENYRRLIFNLMDIPELKLEADKHNIETYKEWQHRKAKESFNDQLEQAIQAKLDIYVWRFALVIELMHQASTGDYTTSLRNESISKAIRLVEYFRINALKIHDKITSRSPLDDLSPIQKEIFNELPIEFKRAEILPLFKDKEFSKRTADRFLKNTKLFALRP